tara:strand:+ start:1220 stop:2848 length:1629 start_codon:yes stop_codon:yes gene_type:complete
MPAIITDQYRILNAETFVDSFVGIGTTGKNNYYTFLGHPNPKNQEVKNYGFTGWGNPVPNPVDSFSQENFYYDSMLFLKKVTADDVRRVVPRINWQTGTIYDMYRNNYSGQNNYIDKNLTPQTQSTTLYGSNYYVVTSEFRVYLCINNGSNPDNSDGQKSTAEPIHTNTAPQPAGDGTDGYLWKYLYTIAPSDIVKFVTQKYIPLPKKWGDAQTENIKNAAIDGEIQTVIVKSVGSGIAVGAGNSGTISGIPISGDGNGGSVTVNISDGKIVDVSGLVGGSGYTYASVRFITDTYVDGNGNPETLGVPDSNVDVPSFEVVIPPKGGHGFDIYRELGGFRVMLYSKFDNNVDDAPDYVVGNNFSRVGLIKNPLEINGSTLLNSTTATNLGALQLKVGGGSGVSTTSAVTYSVNTKIEQTVGLGSTAVAYVASWNPDTGILKYYQPVGFSTLGQYSFKKLDFDGSNDNPITGGSPGNLIINSDFNGESITLDGGQTVALSQTFTSGKASPDVKKYSGDIIYVDNRAPVTRTSSQKEEVKIVIEF